MDTYRINRYNISTPGSIANRLIQGSFRYQKLNLSSPGELTLRNVGVTPTIRNTPLTELPGSFTSSDSKINDIWMTGARTIQLTEIPKNSVPEFWHVSSNGALIDSLSPQAAAGITSALATSYNLDFKVQPLSGGFGFSVLSDTQNSGIYISVNVEAETIAAYVGSTAEDILLIKARLPTDMTGMLGVWQTVHVQVALTDISVNINGQNALNFTQTSKFYGSYGLGASFGHRAVFRDLTVTSIAGAILYSHPLTDTSFLPHFLMGTNPSDISVDGSRRDRIAFTGDLDVAGGAALMSTHGLEYIIGALDLLGSFQATPGFFLPTAKIQQAPLATPFDVNVTGLIGYSWNLLTAAAQTYMHTGDQEFAQAWAPKVVKMLDWAHSQLLPNGLFNLNDITFGGDWNYYDPPQSGVVTKFNVLYAYALQECASLLADADVDVSIYQGRLGLLRAAIDTHLWSDDLGAYYLSDSIKTGFGQDSNAIAILAGVNQNLSHSSEAILSTLSSGLTAAGGPLAFSAGVQAAGFQKYISPFASSYHLRAAFSTQNSAVAQELLESLWAPMADTANVNYSGCFWETLDEFGRPGLGLVTSLCHGWAAGPTAELSRFVLGARPTKAGWVEWEVAPQTIGLTSAQGRIPTPLGTLAIQWEFCGGLLLMSVEAPSGTRGNITLPSPLLLSADQSEFLVNGIKTNGNSFTIAGDSKLTVRQVRK
jgi:hypothetical protein